MNLDYFQRQLNDTNDAIAILEQFSKGFADIVNDLKITDEREAVRLVQDTCIVAAQTGVHAPTMLESALREKLTILTVMHDIASGIDGVASGVMRWTDFAETRAELKALAYPDSFEGKLRRRFEHIPCLQSSKMLYDACQKLTDGIASARIMSTTGMLTPSIH